MKISPPAFPTYLAENMALGMTMRDYFAAAALPLAYKFWMEDFYHPDGAAVALGQHKINEPRMELSDLKDMIALCAYDMANEMMKARNK